MTSHSHTIQVILWRFKKSLHHGGDDCVYPVVATLGTATVELGVVQGGAGGAAQLVDASKEERFAEDEPDLRLSDGSCDTRR